jgi:HSP20 family protein
MERRKSMTLKDMVPWRWGGLRHWEEEARPYESFLREMDSLHKEMDRLFEDFWKGSGSSTFMTGPWQHGALNPHVDETEDEKAFHVKVELPGMDKDDVDVTLSSGVLTIRGEKKREEEEKGNNFYRKERAFGSFRRTLPVPVDVDEAKVEAKFEKGILYIELPKTAEAQKKVKHIAVKAA